LNVTAIPGYLKYPGLVVEKKPGFGFGKTRVGNTIFDSLLIPAIFLVVENSFNYERIQPHTYVM